MDTRQTEIVEGQGLAESRLNTEFIQWLNVWLPRILYVVLAIVLVYSGLQWWDRYQVQQLDKAFAELEIASISGSPAALEAVARDHDGRGSVAQIAILEAADAYLDQARRGMLPGADLVSGTGVLTDEEVGEALTKADVLYGELFGRTSEDRLHTMHVSARWGQASVALQRGDYEAARGMLEEVVLLAEGTSLFSIKSVAEEHIEAIESLQRLEPLLSRDSIASTTPRSEINSNVVQPFLPDGALPGGTDDQDETAPDYEPPKSLLDLQLPLLPGERPPSSVQQENASPPADGDESGS
ncbi:MAG: YfgM family protein [Planctomycetota bacterium]|jgi:hypothetical protein